MTPDPQSSSDKVSGGPLWAPTAAMMLVSLISYIDRNTLALLAPTILKETGLTAEQYGFIISAFSIAYMIGNPVWGALIDRFGLRRGMLTSVSFWSVASAAHAMASGFWSFAVMRAALGFGEGATFPGGLRTAVQTLPPDKRSRGIALAYSGGSLGAIVTPLLITPIAAEWGWRGAFWFTGFIGASWVALWLLLSRKLPNQHTTGTRLRLLNLSDTRTWGFMALYALGGIPLGFVMYIAPIYLNRALHLSQGEIGLLLWIPPLGWEIGYFFWGWLSDKRQAPLARVLVVLAGLSVPLAATSQFGSLPLVMAELFFAMFVAAGFVILSIIYATREFGAGVSGLIAGTGAGSWSAVVAVLMPLFGRLSDQGRYELSFLIAGVLPALGVLLWFAGNRGHMMIPLHQRVD